MADPRAHLSPGLLQKAPNRVTPKPTAKQGGGPSFSDLLREATKTVEAPGLSFSSHAAKRLNQRGIEFTPEQMTKLEDALVRAREKGSRESLFLTRDAALVVGVRQGIVITAMDRQDLRDNVITNIDATVVVE